MKHNSTKRTTIAGEYKYKLDQMSPDDNLAMSPALTQLIERLCERLNECCLPKMAYLDEKAAAEILAAELKPLLDDAQPNQKEQP